MAASLRKVTFGDDFHHCDGVLFDRGKEHFSTAIYGGASLPFSSLRSVIGSSQKNSLEPYPLLFPFC